MTLTLWLYPIHDLSWLLADYLSSIMRLWSIRNSNSLNSKCWFQYLFFRKNNAEKCRDLLIIYLHFYSTQELHYSLLFCTPLHFSVYMIDFSLLLYCVMLLLIISWYAKLHLVQKRRSMVESTSLASVIFSGA